VPQPNILIVGGASLDTLYGSTERVAGGAGIYTAMAAHRCGADVTLYAPKPEPMPAALREIAARLTWLGPGIAPEELAQFEISYARGKTTYVKAFFGAEDRLSTEGLPDELGDFDCVHLVPLGDIRRQQAFLHACRARGARCISAGTALDLINAEPQYAAEILQQADIFYMNDEEATRLFGSLPAVRSRPGQLLFVTHGQSGATVVQGTTISGLPGVATTLRDPTGAGDTFCGASLSGIAAGLHPVLAAARAMPLAAQTITEIGPAALLRSEPAPEPLRDRRVTINRDQLQRIAAAIAGLPEVAAFPFTGPDLPAVGHPAALDYFFATTLQQFGFWSASHARYSQPLLAEIDGEQRKGAFYLFRAWLRWLENDPDMLTPAAQAGLMEAELLAVLRADDGSDPLPEPLMHLELARAYGRDMLALGLSPQSLLRQVQQSPSPLRSLLRLLDRIGGYKEDPLRKKAALLAIILRQRPEAFLQTDEPIPPVVDYHVMRSCLRTGLIDVTDAALHSRLAARALLSAEDEWAVRVAAYHAMQELVNQSGKSMGAVDWFFFQARQRCPEMTPPDCAHCAVDAVCAHRKDLFQPVRRTSFY